MAKHEKNIKKYCLQVKTEQGSDVVVASIAFNSLP